MRISASCRRDVMTRGFTLVELLVVMLVVGLVSALIVPNLGAMLSGVQRFTLRDGVVADLASLSFRAFALGQGFELSPGKLNTPLRDGNPILVLPPGWTLRAETSIKFSFNGSCTGGAVELIAPDGAVERLVLNAPDCRVSAL
jgi:prepilin-type N-terminal cleavage/methylation domain-containing protein